MFKALKKAIFNLEDIEVNKSMTVLELKENFFNTFKTPIKVYQNTNTGKGAKIAPDDIILDDLKGDNKVFKDLFIKKTYTVDEVENMFKNDLGIGIQVMLVNGVDFAPNEVLLLDVKDIKAREIKIKEGNEMALNINGRMKVKTLVSDFKKEFGLTLRVYNGRSFADEGATLASIRKGDAKGGEISPKRNMKVGNLEDKIQELFGIKTQIAGSDDSYLCDNDNTLAKALEVDTKKLDKKSKKEAVTKENDPKVEEIAIVEDNTDNKVSIIEAALTTLLKNWFESKEEDVEEESAYTQIEAFISFDGKDHINDTYENGQERPDVYETIENIIEIETSDDVNECAKIQARDIVNYIEENYADINDIEIEIGVTDRMDDGEFDNYYEYDTVKI